MTHPITVRIDSSKPVEHAIMQSCFEALALSGAVSWCWYPTDGSVYGFTVLCTRGAKPYVMATLRSFARLANDWALDHP